MSGILKFYDFERCMVIFNDGVVSERFNDGGLEKTAGRSDGFPDFLEAESQGPAEKVGEKVTLLRC